jgi:hypothetical protein
MVRIVSVHISRRANVVGFDHETSIKLYIGTVNDYRDMWFRRSEILSPLTSLTSSKVKFEWHSYHQQVIDKIKKVIGTELLLWYPDFNKPFHLYTDASDHQLGAFIMQDKSL